MKGNMNTERNIRNAISFIQGAIGDYERSDEETMRHQLYLATSSLEICLSDPADPESMGFLENEINQAFYEGKIEGLSQGRDIFSDGPTRSLGDQLAPSECNMK